MHIGPLAGHVLLPEAGIISPLLASASSVLEHHRVPERRRVFLIMVLREDNDVSHPLRACRPLLSASGHTHSQPACFSLAVSAISSCSKAVGQQWRTSAVLCSNSQEAVAVQLISAYHHSQFCHLIGTRPINLPPDQKHNPHPESLYHRAVSQKKSQNRTYVFTATLTNTLILSQVVLGAALTGLGASDSSHILITIFGALNTIIAGLIAWLKSRGQPMRARMFRDDLERVVDEIENSAMMWLGISKNVHGYDKIDTDDQVTVRSEVARLTRLYDKAVKTNTLNDPDMYSTGAPTDPHNATLRTATGQAVIPPPAPTPIPAATSVPVSGPPPSQAAVAAPAAAQDPDVSPATKAPEPPASDKSDSETTSEEQSDTQSRGASKVVDTPAEG